MLAWLFKTEEDVVLAVLRFVLGIVFLAHGAQKVLGWFGGYGFSATMNAFTHQMGIPYGFAFLAIAAEFLGGLGLVAGLLSRIAAFGMGVEMMVAVAMVHWSNGFFMNWTGTQKGEGFEYHLLAIALGPGGGHQRRRRLLARPAALSAGGQVTRRGSHRVLVTPQSIAPLRPLQGHIVRSI